MKTQKSNRLFPVFMVASIVIACSPFASTQGIAQQTETADATTRTAFDLSTVNGTWKAVAGKLTGHDLPKEQIDSIQLKINDGKFETVGKGYAENGKLTVAPVAEGQPKPLDVVIEVGPNAGQTIQAIIRLDENRMFVCYAVGGERPTKFESTVEDQTLLLEYEKADE